MTLLTFGILKRLRFCQVILFVLKIMTVWNTNQNTPNELFSQTLLNVPHLLVCCISLEYFWSSWVTTSNETMHAADKKGIKDMTHLKKCIV